MGHPMTKEEFVRKAFGNMVTKKNNYLKTIRTNTDADTFTYGTSREIKKQKHIKW